MKNALIAICVYMTFTMTWAQGIKETTITCQLVNENKNIDVVLIREKQRVIKWYIGMYSDLETSLELYYLDVVSDIEKLSDHVVKFHSDNLLLSLDSSNSWVKGSAGTFGVQGEYKDKNSGKVKKLNCQYPLDVNSVLEEIVNARR